MPYFVALGKAVTSGRGVLECPEEVTPKCLVRGVPSEAQLIAAQENLDRLADLGILVKQDKPPEIPHVAPSLQETDMRPHAPEPEEAAAPKAESKKGRGRGRAQAAKT